MSGCAITRDQDGGSGGVWRFHGTDRQAQIDTARRQITKSCASYNQHDGYSGGDCIHQSRNAGFARRNELG